MVVAARPLLFLCAMLARLTLPIGPWEVSKRTIKESVEDDVLGLAAQQAYYFLFALFPALLTLVSVASYFPLENLTDEVFKTLGKFAPPEVLQIVNEQLIEISNGKKGGLLTFAFLLTLWSSSGAVVSIISTLNAAYDISESRTWWRVRLTAILLTIGLAFFILVSMALVIVGPTLAERLAVMLHMGPVFEWTWKILQWPIVLALVSTGIALVYYFAPDAEQYWVWLTPGAILATTLWLLSSLGLKYYLVNVSNFNETYGAIGGFMVLMFWLYLTSVAILVGAEINAEIEHASPYGKAPGEKVPGQKKKIDLAAEQYYEECKAKGLVD